MNIFAEQIFAIGGSLAGYSVRNAAGHVLEDVWFDVPIKNTIVNRGLRGLLVNPAYSNDISLYISSSDNAGVFTWASRGVGSGATTFDMTELVSRVGNRTNSIFYIVGEQYNGTKFETNELAGTGNVTFRISHQHGAETENRLISELGWGRVNTDNDLFSRVLLPTPISVPEGYFLVTTYDLKINIPFIAETPFTSFGEGALAIPGRARICAGFPLNTDGFVSATGRGFYGIGVQANNIADADAGGTSRGTPLSPSVARGTTQHTGVWIATPPDTPFGGTDFPPLGTAANTISGRTWHNVGGGPSNNPPVFQWSISPYVEGSFERTVYWVLGQGWPNNAASIVFDFIVVAGIGFKLDAPITKLNMQKLTISYTIRWARAI